jgi:hypothetical protein
MLSQCYRRNLANPHFKPLACNKLIKVNHYQALKSTMSKLAKIIELGGIPEVGKSSTYCELTSFWNKNHKWIPADFLYPKQTIHLTNPSSATIFLILTTKMYVQV